MQTRLRVSGMLLLVLTGMLVAAGCDSHTDKISDLIANPTSYASRDVTITGEVTKIYELPLGLSELGIASLSAYRVNDGTGQVWVLSRRGAPVVGDKIGLKGSVRPEGRIAGTALGTIIEEKGRKVQ